MHKALILAAALITTGVFTGQAFADNNFLEESIREAEENGLSSDVVKVLQESGFGI